MGVLPVCIRPSPWLDCIHASLKKWIGDAPGDARGAVGTPESVDEPELQEAP
jgi:hypothetical protein